MQSHAPWLNERASVVRATPIAIAPRLSHRSTGEENLSAIDILAACNLVNYFGKARGHDGDRLYPRLLCSRA